MLFTHIPQGWLIYLNNRLYPIRDKSIEGGFCARDSPLNQAPGVSAADFLYWIGVFQLAFSGVVQLAGSGKHILLPFSDMGAVHCCLVDGLHRLPEVRHRPMRILHAESNRCSLLNLPVLGAAHHDCPVGRAAIGAGEEPGQQSSRLLPFAGCLLYGVDLLWKRR